MKIENWRGIFAHFKETLTLYGDIMMQNSEHEGLSSFQGAINQSAKEHESSAHLFIRCLSRYFKVDDSYLSFVTCTLMKSTLKGFANGTGMPMCILSLGTPSNERTTGYSLMIEGHLFFKSNSLLKTYLIFFLLQNLLMIDSPPGKKSIRPLVAAVNHLVFNITYRRDEVGKKLKKLINLLDTINREKNTQDILGNRVPSN